ncbi:flavodoxin family protein [Candidatus Microgenomates bacterium]|nr:flavodoxin family protein [Candidatus Microgenomates bacterium]
MNILLAYATYSGGALHVAEIIQATLESMGHTVTLKNVHDIDASIFPDYQSVILGTNTWLENKEEGNMNGAYYKLKEQLSGTPFAGKKIALYGLGDSHQYNTSFCQSVDHLTRLVEEFGGTVASELRIDRFYFEKMNNTVRVKDWATSLSSIIG